MTIITNNKVALIISSNFDYAELIVNHYFSIYGGGGAKKRLSPSF